MERRIVSVLFADVVGFTSLSERLDAEDVAAIQDAYFALVRETVARHDGQLEKFIGDAAMAVFGIPRTREDDAVRAVRAALALTAGVEAVGARLGLEAGGLQIRVGVNTGEVAYAESGPDAGRVTGDTVNVAARLQTAAGPGRVLVGDLTALAVAETVDLEPATMLELKGKAEPIRASTVRGIRPQPSRQEALGRLRAPLVGRERELGWIRDAIGALPRGGATTLLVVAPPGVGKSRFVSEAVDLALRDGLLDAAWKSRVLPEGAAYDPIAELARAALDDVGIASTEELAARLATSGGFSRGRADVIAGTLDELLRGDSPGAPDAAEDKQRALRVEAWLDGLDGLAAGRTVVWAIEDLHWSGDDFLSVLAQAGGRAALGGGRRIVLATARPSLLERLGAGAAGDVLPAERLDLPQLEHAATGALVRALVGDVLPSELVDAIGARSDGNPLFVEELLRTWVAVGALTPDPSDVGAWRLNVPVARLTIPSTVQAIYAAQIDDLPGVSRAIVRRGSVAGREFPGDALPALDVPQAGPGIAALVGGRLLSGPRPDPLAGDLYSYRHALLREAGYASLARAERGRLHVRLAIWLEAAAGERVDEVADAIGTHYATALEAAPALATMVGDNLDKSDTARLAAAWLERGGIHARRMTASSAARDLFARSLQLTPADDAAGRARRLSRLGEATAEAADMDEAFNQLQEAVGLYRTLFAHATDLDERREARNGLSESTSRLGHVWHEQIRFSEAWHTAEATLAEIGSAPDDGPDVARGRLLLLMGSAEHDETNADTSQVLQEALAIARVAGERWLELGTMLALSVVRGELGLPDPEGFEATGRLARELGDWSTLASGLTNHAIGLADDDPLSALALLDETDQISDERGLRESQAWAHYVRAEALTALGDLDGAEAHCEKALAIADRYAYRRAAVRTYHLLVPIAAARSDWGPAARVKAFYRHLGGAFPDSPYARIVRPAMDLWISAAGLAPPFVPEVAPRLQSFEGPQSGPSWLLAVERVFATWLEAGELEGANQAVTRMAAQAFVLETTELGRGTIDLLAGRLALAQGSRDVAAEQARAAIARFRAVGARWWIAKALRDLERAGTSTEDERGELQRLERELRISPIV